SWSVSSAMVAVLERLWPLSSALSWKRPNVTEQHGGVAQFALDLGAPCDFHAEVASFSLLWSGASYATPLTVVRHGWAPTSRAGSRCRNRSTARCAKARSDSEVANPDQLMS